MLIKRNLVFSIFITLFFVVLCIAYYKYQNSKYTIDGFTHRASHYFKNENYFQATRYYKKLISMGTTDEKIYINTAISLIRLGYYEKAINHLLKMKKKIAPSSEVYYLLAYSYYLKIKNIDNTNDFKIPIKYLEQNLEIDSRNKESYKLLGNIYEYTNKLENARKWYRKALFEDIENPCEFYGLIANTYFKEYRFDEAMKYYNRAIKNNKNYISAYYNIAEIYKIQKEFNKAEQYYKKIIDITPNYIYSYYQIGNLYFNKEDYETAVKWYNKALDIEPNEATINYYIGIAYKKLNLLIEAIKHLKLATYCGNDDAIKELRTMLETF